MIETIPREVRALWEQVHLTRGNERGKNDKIVDPHTQINEEATKGQRIILIKNSSKRV